MDVKPIPSHEAVYAWPEARQHLLPALERDGSYSDEDILTRIQIRDMQLWLVPGRAAAVTQILDYPKRRTLAILYLGGEGMKGWLDPLIDTIEEFGRAMDCSCLEEHGRKGWERIGKKRGGELVYSVMRKAL